MVVAPPSDAARSCCVCREVLIVDSKVGRGTITLVLQSRSCCHSERHRGARTDERGEGKVRTGDEIGRGSSGDRSQVLRG